MSMGAVAAAASARAERQLVTQLREAGAVNSASAIALPTHRWMTGRVLRRLVRQGAILEASPGYYLNEARYTDYRAHRRRKIVLLISGVAVLAVVASIAVWWVTQP